MQFWRYLTAFGDSAMLLPCALLLVAWLFITPGMRRIGWIWVVWLLVAAGLVTLTKLLFLGWELHPPGWDFTGLSGHSAMAFLVWPVTAALLTQGTRLSVRAAAVAAGGLLALGVSVSRLALGVHSLSEVILGGLWGMLLAALFLWQWWRPGIRLRTPAGSGWVVLGLVVVCLSTYGRMFPSNEVLTWAALKMSGHAQVYERRDIRPESVHAKLSANQDG